MVIRTKQREHLLFEQEARVVERYMKQKAHELDVWIEEFGAWYDHLHLLLRIRPTNCLADVYGQLKGFSAWSLRQHIQDTPFAWADGVYAVTVDPENCDGLRAYIRNQRTHHAEATIQLRWEPPDDSPPGLPLGVS